MALDTTTTLDDDEVPWTLDATATLDDDEVTWTLDAATILDEDNVTLALDDEVSVAFDATIDDKTTTEEDAPLEASSLDKVSIEDSPRYQPAISSRVSGSRTPERSEHETASIVVVKDNSRTFKIEFIKGFLEISDLQARTKATDQQSPCLPQLHSSQCDPEWRFAYRCRMTWFAQDFPYQLHRHNPRSQLDPGC